MPSVIHFFEFGVIPSRTSSQCGKEVQALGASATLYETMELKPPLIKRAYELALQCSSMAEIVRKLTKEGYTGAHTQMSSPTLRRILRATMRQQARKGRLSIAAEDRDDPETDQ